MSQAGSGFLSMIGCLNTDIHAPYAKINVDTV